MADVNEIYGYHIVSTLGQGARSTVYQVHDKKGQVYALKRVIKSTSKDQRFLDQAIQEHEIAVEFNNPLLRRSFRLIKHRNFIRTSEILVIMELVKGFPLDKRQPDSLYDLCVICRQVAKGLGIMHERGYVHADIKPNNIMVDEKNKVKLIDFGQSCSIGTVKERIQGTPDYIAPEQVKRKQITPVTDVYNLGATMYWLFTKQHVPSVMPQNSGDLGASLNTRKTFDPPDKINPDIPPALSRLVMDCVQHRPSKRPKSVDDVVKRLEIAEKQVGNKYKNSKKSDKSHHGMQYDYIEDGLEKEKMDYDALIDQELEKNNNIEHNQDDKTEQDWEDLFG